MRAVATLAIAACSAAPHTASTASGAPPAPPPGCRWVAAGDALRAEATTPGAQLCLAPGRHRGPILVAQGTTLWGTRDAVIERPQGGTVVELAAGASLLGVTVDGRGGVFDRTDAGVKIAGDGARVEAVAVQHAVFGVLADRVAHVSIRGNRIAGGHDPAIGLRGDTIRLWEVQDSVIEDNIVDGGRDTVVWYSSGNRIANNRIAGGRYGTHFMYSHHNEVVGNRYDGDVVGVFVMYSHDVALRGNTIANTVGAAGMGIGLKDSGNISVIDNVLVHDQTCLYLDQTPLQQSHTLAVEHNRFARCNTAIRFHASGHRSAIRDNDFFAAGSAVAIEGGGDAADVAWRGNYFDDYAGYDLEGDGTGDVPFQLRSLESDLTDQRPALAFFRGTPALAAADAVTRLVPMYEQRILLTDPAPRMHSHPRQDHDAD